MKVRLLIVLLLCCDLANADDGKEQSADGRSQKQGETIWLEEKISPTTRWVENLVKPLTIWMEQQINEPETEPGLESEENSQRSGEGPVLNLNETGSDEILEPASLIGAEQASNFAKEHIAGDVLYNKLLLKKNRYRVKLISKLGEIHIIYINAISGEIVAPNDKMGAEPAKQTTPEQDNQANSDSDDDKRAMP